MTNVDRVAALLEALQAKDFEPLAPDQRRRFADACARVVRLAQVELIVDDARKATAPKGGILRQPWATD
jgi:hypothetical protein